MPPRTNKIDQHKKKPSKAKTQGEADPPEQHPLTNPEPPAVSRTLSESEIALYKDLSPERQSRVKNYICTLDIIENEAEDIKHIRTYMSNPLNSPTGGEIYLEMNKEEEEKDIEEVKRNYEAAVREAAKQAEQHINRIRTVAKDKRESMEKLIAEDRVFEIKTKVDEVVANAKDAKKRKHELEQEGGFQLGLDVGMIEERRKRKRETE
jgi:hypothetical protein